MWGGRGGGRWRLESCSIFSTRTKSAKWNKTTRAYSTLSSPSVSSFRHYYYCIVTHLVANKVFSYNSTTRSCAVLCCVVPCLLTTLYSLTVCICNSLDQLALSQYRTHKSDLLLFALVVCAMRLPPLNCTAQWQAAVCMRVCVCVCWNLKRWKTCIKNGTRQTFQKYSETKMQLYTQTHRTHTHTHLQRWNTNRTDKHTHTVVWSLQRTAPLLT